MVLSLLFQLLRKREEIPGSSKEALFLLAGWRASV